MTRGKGWRCWLRLEGVASCTGSLYANSAKRASAYPEDGYCQAHESICAKLVHGYVEAHKFIHDHPQQALAIALKRMPHANKQDLENSLAELIKTTPLVPRYKPSDFQHAQEFMIFGGILKKDEATKNFDSMFTNKYVDMFAKPAV